MILAREPGASPAFEPDKSSLIIDALVVIWLTARKALPKPAQAETIPSPQAVLRTFWVSNWRVSARRSSELTGRGRKHAPDPA
jgi:hypothetical protein